jgi:type I restriction enzyme S subunit
MANKTARLGDLATYINGYAFKPADWGDTGLPIIRIQDLTGNSYQLNRYDGEYPERIEVNDGDVLISWSASLGVYVWQRGKALLNQHIFKVVFDKLPINKDYFVFAVEHKLAEMESKTHGATMKHIVKKDFDGTTIPYPTSEKQAEIADHLRRITSIIDRQTEQLLLLDQLVKSRFIELFGDPETNPKGWTRQRLDQICENLDSRRVPITSTNRKAGNYPYYGASGIVDYVKDYIFDEDILLISEDGANLVMRSTPIAFSVSGKVWVNNHAHVVRFESKATQKYIEICFALTDISGSITGTAQPKLNQAKLNAMMFCVPPIELQEQFATFVEQTDKSKLCGTMEVAA